MCLPVDFALAIQIRTVTSPQQEIYRALATVFKNGDVLAAVLLIPFAVSTLTILALHESPKIISTTVLGATSLLCGIAGILVEIDFRVLSGVPLFASAHPLTLTAAPFIRDFFFAGCVAFGAFLFVSLDIMQAAVAVFHECIAAVLAVPSIFLLVSGLVLLKGAIVLHVCRKLALMMSVLHSQEEPIELFGEFETVVRTAADPYYLRALLVYSFGAYWLLEFVSTISKYLCAELLCANYFQLPYLLEGTREPEKHLNWLREVPYAIRSVGYHLGSFALGAVLQLPLRLVRGLILIFLPDRPNLWRSPNPGDRIIYFMFYPIIQLDLHLLRFFNDSVYVMIALKGYSYFPAARRAAGLLNRSRGKIPNLVKFTVQVDQCMHLCVGMLAVVWTFFFFREPRAKSFHGFHDSLEVNDAMKKLVEAPAHSPLLALPVSACFGLWIGQGMMHLLTMASETLTICYCIDVEMAGGTETDALYIPSDLASMFKDMGGSESEREMAEAMLQMPQQGQVQ